MLEDMAYCDGVCLLSPDKNEADEPAIQWYSTGVSIVSH